jgi:hypothetical protein
MFQAKVFYTYREFLDSKEDYDYPRKPTEKKVLSANTKEELENLVVVHNTRIYTDYNLSVAAMRLADENDMNESRRIREEEKMINDILYDEETARMNFFWRKLRHISNWYNGTHTIWGQRKF